ncbi:MAG: 4-diphosphocytidyl-2C-methyl-D-erythritol kinase [Hyphomicrobiales bacterium]|nr:4-diphosphocytidyl-2C-methyl-D-erythritol kinase [Hyphomicrobiales bacterium]
MSDVAAIILAAGSASRFRAQAGEQGPETKLVARHAGKALVRHVAEAALAAGLSPCVVVTGHAAGPVEAELAGLSLTFMHNESFATGMASSLTRGLSQLPDHVRGVVVLLGDMPLVSADLIMRLTAAFSAKPGVDAVIPTVAGHRGNPVLLSARMFPALAKLEGDAGARQALRGDAQVVELEVGDDAARIDIDTPEALAALCGHVASKRTSES